MIAALFVQEKGCYSNLPGVDPWPESRDARKYAGPYPVVAHPPCARWGRFSEQAFGHVTGRTGDDMGCFESALASIRQWGGILEHPARSKAWPAFGLIKPGILGWTPCGNDEYTCLVEQGHYGHILRKPTWLYAKLPIFPGMLMSGNSKPDRVRDMYCNLSKNQRSATPARFRDLLIYIAESCN